MRWRGGTVTGMRDRTRYRNALLPSNIECLSGYDFVFVSVDAGPARLLIVDWLSGEVFPMSTAEWALTGQRKVLSGFVRVTEFIAKLLRANVNSAQLPTQNAKVNEYRKQAQITELNAINAAMAVIRFKQYFKLSRASG